MSKLGSIFSRALRLASGGPVQPSVSAGSRMRMADITPSYVTGWATDPDLVLANIKKRRHELRMIETDEEVFTAMSTRLDALVGTPWRLEDPEGDLADLIEECLRPVMADLLGYAWRALPYGFSVVDITYMRRDDGRIGIEGVRDMPIQLFKFDAYGRCVFMRPGGDARGEYLDPAKLLLTRHRPSTENPFGEALLSRLYWPWYFRNNLWRFRMEYLERFIDPLIAGKVGAPQAFIKAMQESGFVSAVAVGKDESIEVVTAQGTGEHDAAEKALNARIQRAVLGQTLTSDVQGGGSYAAANIHNLVRMDRREADIRMVLPTVQRVVDALGAMNSESYKPGDIEIVIGDIKGLESERAKRDAEFLKTGKVKLSKEYFVRAYDFDEDEIEIIEPVIPPALGGPNPSSEGQDPPQDPQDDQDPEDEDQARQQQLRAILAASGRRFTKKQQQVEDLGSAALRMAKSPIPRDKLRAAILGASDPEDLVDRLAALLGDLPPDEFQAIAEQAIFAADVLGYIHAQEEGRA